MRALDAAEQVFGFVCQRQLLSGNILMQAVATGQIKTLAEARQLVRNPFELKEYQPQEASLWKKQYKKSYL